MLSLVALLLAMEVGARVFETRLSKDLAYLRELPAVAQRMKESDAYKVLIIGNSLARYGIDKAMLERRLQGKGYGEVLVEGFHQDATGITEWNYGLRRYFLNVGAIPDWIILVTAGKHLLDHAPHSERLGAFYVDKAEVEEAIFNDLRSVENGSRFFLARFSSLFASRARIQPFVFYNYLPEYSHTIQTVNGQRKALREDAGIDTEWGASNLSRLLRVVRSKGIVLSVVGVPMEVNYALPQVVLDEVRKQGLELWDLSEIAGIDDENFFDGYHLDAEGGRRVTDELMNQFFKQKDKNGD